MSRYQILSGIISIQPAYEYFITISFSCRAPSSLSAMNLSTNSSFYTFSGYFPLNAGVCVMWATFDVLMCTASIWHMCTMSMDRYFTLKYPMKYGRNKTRTMVALKILFVWVISISISCPVCILGFLDYRNVFNSHTGACVPTIRSFIIYGSLFAFYIPLCIMILTYVLTIKILCDNQKLMKSIAKQQGDRRGKKDKNGAYAMAYLSPNVYVPRYMDRASIDTTASAITINETSLINDNLSSAKEEEELNLDPPLVPEPSPDWSQRKKKPVNEEGLQPVLGWENRNGQASAVDKPAPAYEKPGFNGGNDLQVGGQNQASCSSSSLLCGQTNNAFSSAFDPDTTRVRCDDKLRPSQGQMGYFPNDLSDPLSHITSPSDLMLSSSQPHLPSALSSPLSSIRMRTRLTSAPSCGIRLNNSGSDTQGQANLNTISNSSAGHLYILSPPNETGFEGLSKSPTSSYGSVHSRNNWGSNSAMADFEDSELQEKLSMIEQEMDECIRQGPSEERDPGSPQQIRDIEEAGDDGNRGEEDEEEDEENVETEDDIIEDGDPARESLYKQDSEDMGNNRLNLPPSVLVSSPPNISSDDTPNESDSEKSNLITIHLKASGCYLYQIDPVKSGFAMANGSRNETRTPTPQQNQTGSSDFGGNYFSGDESEREQTHEVYYMNDTEESCSESGNAKMIVRKLQPSKKKKKLNSRIRSCASGWRALMKRKKKDMPVCKVNGLTPVTIMSKRTASNEKKASKVLGIIFGVFVVLWTPFFMMNIVSVVCEECMDTVTPAMMACIVWFGYMSSLANPIIYTMFNTAFRKTFYRILTCKYPRKYPHRIPDNMMMTTATNWGSLSADRRNTLTITLRE